MSTRPDLRPSAVAASPRSGPARSGGAPQFDSAVQLERLSARLDNLIRDVRLGVGSHREHERRVDEAEEIAAGLRAVFRERAPARPVNPPIWQAPGKAAW
jgi:hypothetical protein